MENFLPGINGKSFHLYFSDNWIKKGDVFLPSRTERIKTRIQIILQFLGCYVSYQLKVLSDPVERDDEGGGCFEYEVKIVFRKIHIFGILVYKDTKQPKWIIK